MLRRMLAIAALYVVVCIGWVALGGSVLHRTWNTGDRLGEEVAELWGDRQEQLSPEAAFVWEETVLERETIQETGADRSRTVEHERRVTKSEPRVLDRSKIDVDLRLEQRRKGLLWYATYGVAFRGDYAYVHEDEREGWLELTYRFPTTKANYDNFRFEVGGRMDPNLVPLNEADGKIVRQRIPVKPGQSVPFAIGYASRGLEWWRYSFGKDVNRVRNFDMTMTTNFKAIDHPRGTISPTSREESGEGWALHWASENLISGFSIGMAMPRKLNPGPLAAEMTFFAPVSLAFFFVWMFVITLLKRIELHPMNYLFLGAAFFAFHLLFAYSADHIDVVPAFLSASAVSVFLVVSYLRLVVGLRFAAVEAGISQLVYLVFFSWAHFLEGFTGLIVTIGAILTLFALMQLTGKIRWSEVESGFSKPGGERRAVLPV